MSEEATGLKIADREKELYLGEAGIILQKRDWLELSANKNNESKMIEIKNWLAFLGIVLEREHIQKINISLTPEMVRDLRYHLGLLKKGMGDEVKVANRDWRFYLGLCMQKFSRYDKVTLSAKDCFLGATLYMPSILNAVGIEVSKDCKNTSGRIQVQKKEENVSEEDGINYRIKVNKIVLEKGPELKDEEEIELCSAGFVYMVKKSDLPSVISDNPDVTKCKLVGKLIPRKDKIENYQNKNKGRYEELVVSKLNLIKIPTLFMYTSR